MIGQRFSALLQGHVLTALPGVPGKARISDIAVVIEGELAYDRVELMAAEGQVSLDIDALPIRIGFVLVGLAGVFRFG
jgi:hypothetical protein